MPAPLRRLSAALAAAALLASGCAGTSAVDQTAGSQFRFVDAQKTGSLIPSANRKPAEPFSGSLLNGASYHSALDSGNVTLINFWATWCAPCVIETPQLDQVYRQYKSRGVRFVGIDTKEALRDQPRSFVRDHHISYPIVFDESGRVATELGHLPVQGLPFSVLVDKRGRVAAVYTGRLAPADLEPVLNQLVAEKV
jgi:thiol-disulfide isomerase/thioredoxin